MELKSTKICPVCHKQALVYGFRKFHCTNCNAYQRKSNAGEKFRIWCIDKNWIWRLILLAVVSYIFWRIYNFPESDFFGYSLPIAFHSLGYIVEIAIPLMILLISLMLYYYFAAVIATIWLAANLLDISQHYNFSYPYYSSHYLHQLAAVVFMIGLTFGVYTIGCMVWSNRKSVQA